MRVRRREWRTLGLDLLQERTSRENYEDLTDTIWGGRREEKRFHENLRAYDEASLRRNLPSLSTLALLHSVPPD